MSKELHHDNLDYENIEQMIVGRTIESRVPEAFFGIFNECYC